MADTPYPLLRRTPRRPRRRAGAKRRRLRLAAIVIVALAAIGGAVKLAWRARPVDPDAAIVASLRALGAGHVSAARDLAQRAVLAAPGRGDAHAVLARMQLETGDGAAAAGSLDRARGAGMPAARLHALRAEALLLQWQLDAALAEAARAFGRYAPYGERIAARALAARGDTGAAIARLQTLTITRPGDAGAWTDLTRIALAAGRIDEASRAGAQAAARAPHNPAALTAAGDVIRSRYGLAAALPWYRAALVRDPRHYPALIRLAATLGDLGRYHDMLAATRSALTMRPGDPQALYLQSMLALRAGDDELASTLFNRGGHAAPDIAGALLVGGALDYRAGRYEQAARQWSSLSGWRPSNAVARRLLAAAALRAGDPARAIAALQPLAARRDADGYTTTLLARAFEAIGNRDAAAAWLDRATGDGAGAWPSPGPRTIAAARAEAARWPGVPDSQTALGDALAADGRFAAATLPYARAADLRFDPPTLLRLVDALGRAGQPREAAASLAVLLRQNPQSLPALRVLGRWQVERGDNDGAIETLERVRAVAGTRDAGLLADLALAYAGSGEAAVALRYARAAYRLQPMSVATCDAYGVALAAAGDRAGARRLFGKTRALAPGDPRVAARLRAVR